MLRRVRVELGLVLSDLVSELILLELPDVEFLITVLVHFHALGNVEALLGRATCTHVAEGGDVFGLEVEDWSFISLLEAHLEIHVLAFGVTLSLG